MKSEKRDHLMKTARDSDLLVKVAKSVGGGRRMTKISPCFFEGFSLS
jgi:hypothetical protein